MLFDTELQLLELIMENEESNLLSITKAYFCDEK
jgi:hypothetical protein